MRNFFNSSTFHLSILDPSRVLKVAVTPVFIDADVCTTLLLANPVVDDLLLLFVQHDFTQYLEILGDGGTMALYAILQFGDGTNSLHALVGHLKGF